MTVNQLLYSKEEFARRGNEIYESQVRPQVEEGNHGKIVAMIFPKPSALNTSENELMLISQPG